MDDNWQRGEAPIHRNACTPWLEAEGSTWNLEVGMWLEQAGHANGLGRIVSRIGIKARPWSMVLRVEFQLGIAYFKACGRGGRHEPALLNYLAGQWPGHIPTVLAADLTRSWLLLADSGVPMRDAFSPELQVRALKCLLPQYGEMQLNSVTAVDTLLGMGLPDRRPARLPELLEGLLEGQGFPQRAQPDVLRDAALRLLPVLDRCCRRLVETPYAAALDHGDLHTGNFLVHEDSYRLADWGDACVGYPFCSLGVLLETVVNLLPEAERPGTAAQLVAAYLEPWGRLASPGTLRREIEAALWMAHVVRALDFAHMCREKDDDVGPEWQSYIVDALAAWVGMPVPELAGVS
jgi:hypothetical protein